MRLSFLSAALLAAAAFAHADSSFPAGYWERSYYGSNAQSETVTAMLVVKNLVRAEAEIDRRITKAGGTLTSMNGNANQYSNGQPQQKMKNVTYSIEAGKADAAARSVFEFGELQQFSDQKQPQISAQLDEIKKKLTQVDEEIAKNAESLKTMPIAAYFLNTQHDRLIQSRDSIESGMKKATITLTLSETPADKK
jgi:hypothetical protein